MTEGAKENTLAYRLEKIKIHAGLVYRAFFIEKLFITGIFLIVFSPFILRAAEDSRKRKDAAPREVSPFIYTMH